MQKIQKIQNLITHLHLYPYLIKKYKDSYKYKHVVLIIKKHVNYVQLEFIINDNNDINDNDIF